MNKLSLTEQKNQKMSRNNRKRSKISSQPAFLDKIVDIVQPKPGSKSNPLEEKFFKKIASKKSLSNQGEESRPNDALFDFYIFNDGYENYDTSIRLRLPLNDRMVHSALTKFHNGVTLIILHKILNLVDGDKILDYSTKMREIRKNCIILREIIQEIDDKFALTLLNRELFHDLENYLSVYLFSSTVYQGKILDYIKKLFQKKFFTGLEQECDKNVFDMTKFMQDIVAKSSIEKTVSFVYMQILEELNISMDIYTSFVNSRGGKTKTQLYDSRISTKREPEYLLVLLKIESGFSLCFGNRLIQASEGQELMSAFRSSSKRYSSLRGSSEKFLKFPEKSFREANSVIKDSQFIAMESSSRMITRKSADETKLRAFINIQDRFISKTIEASPKIKPSIGHNFEITPLRQNFTNPEDVLTRSDDKFLKGKMKENQLLKNAMIGNGKKEGKKMKKSKSIKEIKGRIKKLKTKANEKVISKTGSSKKLVKEKGKAARPSTHLTKNRQNLSERKIKAIRPSHKTGEATVIDRSASHRIKPSRKSLRFATTGSVLDKIKKKKRKMKEMGKEPKRHQNGQKGKKSKSCKKQKKKIAGKQARLSKQIERDSSKAKPNSIRRRLKLELDEIAEDDECKGYFVANQKPNLDQIDHLIKENNLAITTVLKKFKSTPPKNAKNPKTPLARKTFPAKTNRKQPSYLDSQRESPTKKPLTKISGYFADSGAPTIDTSTKTESVITQQQSLKPIPRAGVVVKRPSAVGYSIKKTEIVVDFYWDNKKKIFMNIKNFLGMLESNDTLIEKNYDLSRKLKKMKTVKSPKNKNQIYNNKAAKSEKKIVKSKSPRAERVRENPKKEITLPKKKMTFSPKVKSKVMTRATLRNKRANIKSTPTNIEQLLFSPQSSKIGNPVNSFNYYCSKAQNKINVSTSNNISSIRGSNQKRVSVKKNSLKVKNKLKNTEGNKKNDTYSVGDDRFNSSHHNSSQFKPDVSTIKGKSNYRVSYGSNMGGVTHRSKGPMVGQSPRNGRFSNPPYNKNPYFGLTFAPGNNGPIRGKF